MRSERIIAAVWVLSLLIFGCSDVTVDPPIPVAMAPAKPDEPRDGLADTDTKTENETETETESDPTNVATEPPDSADDLDVPAAGENKRLHALLVGCTTYEHLGPSARLRGPINDVRMFRAMLIDRFKCSSDQIEALTEGRGDSKRPTKANIVSGFQKLAQAVKDGDQVVILLSGHGSQQPNDNPDDASDPEPDGLDEIFCPADVGGIEMHGDAFRIKNALSDDEIHANLSAIEQKGAFVWIIIDACHSGSAARGTEVYRQLDPEQLLSRDIVQKARQRARNVSGNSASSKPVSEQTPPSGKHVALYAAQPHEPTVELPFDSDDGKPQWRGLLSATLAKVLAQSTTDLTYRELVQRIHAQYLHDQGRLGPTPLIEGSGVDQVVLADETASGRSQLIVSRREGQDWILSGGELHGLTKGTIVAVYPAPGAKEENKVLGHLEIRAAQLVESFARPVAFDELPATESLPIGGRCRPAQVNYGELALRVAINVDENASPTVDEVIQWITRWQKELQIAVQYEDHPDRADWLIRCDSSGVSLIPAAGWTTISQENAADLGSGPSGEASEVWLRERLKRISRVHRLLKVCGVTRQENQRGWLSSLLGEKRCNFKITLKRIDPQSEEATPLKWSKQGMTLKNGDVVALEIKNTGKERIDFSVLFVDSRFGITPLFPEPNTVADNRLNPAASMMVGPMAVQADSLGVEHLVVVATVAAGQPVEFGWLAQDSIEQAKAATRGAAGFEHPVGKLMQEVLYSSGKMRGMRMVQSDSVHFQVLSWETVADVPQDAKTDAP